LKPGSDTKFCNAPKTEGATVPGIPFWNPLRLKKKNENIKVKKKKGGKI